MATAAAPSVRSAIHVPLTHADKARLANLTSSNPPWIFVGIHSNGAIHSYPFSVWSARFNQLHTYKDKELRLVFGRLTLGEKPVQAPVESVRRVDSLGRFRVESPSFEYETSLQPIPMPYVVATCAWLEDEEGKVYDTVNSEWVRAAQQTGINVQGQGGVHFPGISKTVLAAHGYHYQRFSQKAQTTWFKNVFSLPTSRPRQNEAKYASGIVKLTAECYYEFETLLLRILECY